MTDPVQVSYVDRIAVIRIGNPPVNALSHAVRRGILKAIEEVQKSPDTDGAILVGDGRTFIAGADIKEFNASPQPPSLPEVIAAIEGSRKPILAVLHGTALGGGLEVALGAHFRIAIKGLRVGLPEVTLGLLPGAGGTQRLPRLVGVEPALDLITSGRHVPADEALELGIVDELSAESDPESAGLDGMKRILANSTAVRRLSEQPSPDHDNELFTKWRRKLEKSSRGAIAPLRCIDAIEAATQRPFEEGLAEERRLFTELRESPQRECLVHAFFAERKVSKLPELEGIEPRSVARIGVIGGGTMGTGIAFSALLNGLDVTLIERDEEAVQKAADRVKGLFEGSVKRGKLTADRRIEIEGTHFHTDTDYTALSEADLVIEAVFEDMSVKQEVFQSLDRICKPGAVLATNTSYLDVNEIAATTGRAKDVIGLHFFSPAHIMRLLEIVVGDETAPDVTATAFALAKTLKKIGVRAGVCDGFIGNRIYTRYRSAADNMVLDGASPYAVDRVVTAFGFAMGPFATADLAGLDIGWAARKRRAPHRDPRERVPSFADRICERGWFGQKAGRGYYLYPDGARRGTPDPEVEAIIEAEREAQGITPRTFDDDEIIRRYLAAMINEASNVIAEEFAQRPLDVDVVFLHGYGFPRWRGGPMKYADDVGLDTILSDIRRFAKDDDYFWQPAELLVDLVENGSTFDSLNQTEGT